MKTKEPFSNEGFKLMGAAFEVHNETGGGLLEEIYQECMEMELEFRGIPFEAHEQIQTFYKNRKLKKNYIPDLLVYRGIVVELKAVSKLAPEHEAQLLNYMRLSQMPIGYLVNFGPIEGVEWKRFILSEYLNKPDSPIKLT